MPSTKRSPLILTAPVLSPTVSGSITNVAGPAIVAVVLDPLIIDTPTPVVMNLSVTSSEEAVTAFTVIEGLPLNPAAVPLVF